MQSFLILLNSLLPDRFLPRVNFFYLFHPLEEVRILKAKEGVVLFVECQVWHIPMNLLKKIRLSPRVQILYFQVYMYVMYQKIKKYALNIQNEFALNTGYYLQVVTIPTQSKSWMKPRDHPKIQAPLHLDFSILSNPNMSK